MERGRVEFLLELALVEANPEFEIRADALHPELSFSGTINIQCHETGSAGDGASRMVKASEYSGLDASDFGPDRVYVLGDRVDDEARDTMGLRGRDSPRRLLVHDLTSCPSKGGAQLKKVVERD